MRTAILVAAGVFLTAQAEAAGINMYWDDCGAGGGVINRNFACNTNDGYQDLYLSVDPPEGVVATNGHNHIVDLQSKHSPLPAWWDFKNTGTCRQTALLGSGDFTTGLSGGVACVDPWDGQGNAGVAAYTKNFNGSACQARIIGSIAYSGPDASMASGTEYYSIKLRITNARTVASGACGDCPDPVCLVLNQVRIAQPAPNTTFAVENPRDSNFATWQQGWFCPSSHPASCIVSPTAPSTWGLLKSLYR